MVYLLYLPIRSINSLMNSTKNTRTKTGSFLLCRVVEMKGSWRGSGVGPRQQCPPRRCLVSAPGGQTSMTSTTTLLSFHFLWSYFFVLGVALTQHMIEPIFFLFFWGSQAHFFINEDTFFIFPFQFALFLFRIFNFSIDENQISCQERWEKEIRSCG